MKNQLIGIIACGGSSTRMGTDKGLIKVKDLTWAEIAFQKSQSLSIPSFISINKSQEEVYSKIFTLENLSVDSLDIKGPLAGLLTTHKNNTHVDILLLACDMIDIENKQLNELIDIYINRSKEYDFFVYKNNDEFEPMPGIYTAKGLSKIAEEYDNKILKKHSLKYVLDSGNCLSITITNSNLRYFKNYNRPD
jgi:molybdopterin-guanine dinucleotide biosynthesis protein A